MTLHSAGTARHDGTAPLLLVMFTGHLPCRGPGEVLNHLAPPLPSVETDTHQPCMATVQTCRCALQRGGENQAVSTREQDTTGPSLFVAELVAARTAAGLSQDALASQINYSPSLIGMIESGRRAPTLDIAERLDKALRAPGTLARLQQHARTTPLPSWFRPYADVEATAAQLRSWQPLVIDGLLQTEDYARALLAMRPDTSAEELDELVAARMERQAVLARDRPPTLWTVMDEGALQREIRRGQSDAQPAAAPAGDVTASEYHR
jgi:transcriptional regulator with XRE-family HTH domain